MLGRKINRARSHGPPFHSQFPATDRAFHQWGSVLHLLYQPWNLTACWTCGSTKATLVFRYLLYSLNSAGLQAQWVSSFLWIITNVCSCFFTFLYVAILKFNPQDFINNTAPVNHRLWEVHRRLLTSRGYWPSLRREMGIPKPTCKNWRPCKALRYSAFPRENTSHVPPPVCISTRWGHSAGWDAKGS